MRESCTYGSARGVPSNEHPYRYKLHHAPVAFGLIIGEGNGWIAKET